LADIKLNIIIKCHQKQHKETQTTIQYNYVQTKANKTKANKTKAWLKTLLCYTARKQTWRMNISACNYKCLVRPD